MNSKQSLADIAAHYSQQILSFLTASAHEGCLRDSGDAGGGDLLSPKPLQGVQGDYMDVIPKWACPHFPCKPHPRMIGFWALGLLKPYALED